MSKQLNIADRLRQSAARAPQQRAVVFPEGRDHQGRVAYTHLTFQQLDQEADQIARGLIEMGVRPGHRLILMVRPSLEFIALTFGIFRSGAVCTLIDPGMGRSSIFKCLDEVQPDGFIAIPVVHAIRRSMGKRFADARFNVVVGRVNHLLRKTILKASTYQQLIDGGRNSQAQLPQTQSTDHAAIIFTSGSTGPPKGVCYEHGMFNAQVDLIRDRFDVQPGETDLPGFPLFALFNIAMQATTVIPDMDPTRPANVDPVKLLEAIHNQNVTQAFGSPALWNRFARYCEDQNITLPTINRTLSAGAPVPNHVVRRMVRSLRDNADIFTPYGATECLPVAVIGGRQVLNETAALTADGHGTCVGTIFSGMEARIIQASFEPISEISEAVPLPTGQIGEIIVKGPVATREYFRRPDATAMAKIKDGDSFWHRMGDVGYFDDQSRLWFCGRKAHIVFAQDGPMYSVCCEAIVSNHPHIYRCALVGIGPKGTQLPVIVAEPEAGHYPVTPARVAALLDELKQLAAAHPLTRCIQTFLLHRALPVDTRHNVKINREQLAEWAATRV
ncbi:MAG: AMP-binding protein [Planctomycetaceae bacterium]|nr:AMP-binding protein [Planctomycetaceae bacterium]